MNNWSSLYIRQEFSVLWLFFLSHQLPDTPNTTLQQINSSCSQFIKSPADFEILSTMSSTAEYPQGEIFAKMFSPVQNPQDDGSSDIKSISEHHSEQEQLESESHYEPLDDETLKHMREKKREMLKRKRAKTCKPEY